LSGGTSDLRTLIRGYDIAASVASPWSADSGNHQKMGSRPYYGTHRFHHLLTIIQYGKLCCLALF